jgi:putative transcriptional regulator
VAGLRARVRHGTTDRAGLRNPGYNTQVQNVNLTHHFLIAMPAMEDPDFTRSLVYVAEHNDEGALGVVINRPIDLTVEGLFERVDIPFEVKALADDPIYFGGPVQTDRGFVLHRPIGEWQSSLKVNDNIALTSSKDILQALGSSGDPAEVLITLGYSGWGAGQLEEELAQNAWLTVPADAQIIFSLPPDERLTAAMQLLGVDFTNLSDVAGHA